MLKNRLPTKKQNSEQVNLAKPVSATPTRQPMWNGQLKMRMKRTTEITIVFFLAIAIITLGFFVFGLYEKIENLNTFTLGTASGDGNFPTSFNNFQDNDTIQAKDWSKIEWVIGTTTEPTGGFSSSTATSTLWYKLTTSTNPGHLHTTFSSSTAPTTATSTCTAGNFSWDTSYFYYCVGTGVWRRATSTTF